MTSFLDAITKWPPNRLDRLCCHFLLHHFVHFSPLNIDRADACAIRDQTVYLGVRQEVSVLNDNSVEVSVPHLVVQL